MFRWELKKTYPRALTISLFGRAFLDMFSYRNEELDLSPWIRFIQLDYDSWQFLRLKLCKLLDEMMNSCKAGQS